MSYEVLTAFFLEAGFLGIMLFGWKRVPKGVHFFASLMVAFGTLLSAFWILSANSWNADARRLHCRRRRRAACAGLVEGHLQSLLPLPLRPHGRCRLSHHGLHGERHRRLVHLARAEHPGGPHHARHGLEPDCVARPLQLVIGDLHGLNTREYQPAKIAALEAHWNTERGAPLILFALPDPKAETNHFELAVPRLGSLILTHEWDGEIRV